MFGRKSTPAPPSNSSAPRGNGGNAPDSNALNSLVKGTLVEGTVKAESDIRVDGTIKGTLTCNAKVIIGPSGIIEGDIVCENAVIEGKFNGQLRVTDLLSVKETAEVIGDIITDKLLVQPGAIFNVTCNMKQASKPQETTPSVTAAPNVPAGKK